MDDKKHGEQLIQEAHEEIQHAREALEQAKKLLGEPQHQVFIPDQDVIDKGAHQCRHKHHRAQ